ncbi:hypothetical protein QQZ08_009863 [Neonectria magnoliae]|uniref:Uncharacterized protein n=1 Tax=Neonectria magnoliae TaxID=2732573 RepID=A0ABR1HKP7_9HYPO
MALIDPANCNGDADAATPSDAGVAGTGVSPTLAHARSVIFGEFRGRNSVIRRKLLNSYSDSQIMQGIGIQSRSSVGLAKMNTLVPYHFFLIWMLSLLSMATHNATLLALVHDYRRDWVLRWMRQFLMFVNLALSCVSGVFVLEAVSKGLDDKTLPIACVWQIKGNGAPSTAGLSFVGTIAVIAGNVVIFGLATWYLHSRNQKFYKLIQIAGLVLMTAIAIGAAIRIILLCQAFGNPSVELKDDNEKTWGFGQLLSMLLLIMPLVSTIEIYRGEIQVAEPVEDEKTRVYDGELQENPQGSRTNLFSK